ncbi:tyrosine-protein kinase receptor-like isoform X2 [Antedon mediterranea]|uniref:tyrosine-protein kinase receptor-like isoform X2 n=1 Tax=Antedon mediterranea TaxID=105859 RepID=UPI003AF4244C
MFKISLVFRTCQICVIIACVISVVVSQNVLQRLYDFNPVIDTFIEDDRSINYRKENLELGRTTSSSQSCILMKFDIDAFKSTSEWDSGSTNLNKSTLISAKLRLTYTSGSLNNTVSASRIVRSWFEEVVTSKTRGRNGELWSISYLDTTGGDATPAIAKKYIRVNSEPFVFEVEIKEILEYWLENAESNHGLLLWLENSSSSFVKFASTDNALISLHPVLKVVLEDVVFVKGVVCGFETPCGWDTSVSEGAIGWTLDSAQLRQEFYIYVNGSQEPSGTVSELSQGFRNSARPCTLHFDFFMNATEDDSLSVVIVYKGTEYTVWTKAGTDPNDSWHGDVLNIGQLEGTFRIIFRARTTGTKPGIIGVDNISLRDCSPDPDNTIEECGTTQMTCMNLQCVSANRVCDFHNDCLLGEDENTSVCGVMPEGSRCNFEDGLCGWWDIVGEDHFNWTRHKGKTPTKNTGPKVDHTLGTKSGYYIYTEVSDKTILLGHNAYIRSPWLPPPPPEVGNATSPFYRMCQIRFYHHLYGIHSATVKLYVYFNDTRNTISQLFSDSTSSTEVPWTLEEVYLPYTDVNYYLQFEATKGRSYRGDAALDDISLSRECFTLDHLKQTTTTVVPLSSVTMVTDMISTLESTQTSNIEGSTWFSTQRTQQQTYPGTSSTKFEFNTCGVKGRNGPKQLHCDRAYQHSNVSVQVVESGEGVIPGVQMWTVPVTRLYRIAAKGASGGRGIESSQDSVGAVVVGTFNLTKGDVLYILVGQEGESACDEDHKLLAPHCEGLDDKTRADYGPGGRHAGGGGGGGGASYVAMFNETSGEWYPLLVAGGGGGLALSERVSQNGKNGQIGDQGSGSNGLMNLNETNTPGSGGGWKDNTSYLTSGKSFFQGAIGGTVCHAGFEDNQWRTSGGFGGGGGPCVSGGGGGGYTGGDASLTKDIKAYGFGGMSYTSSQAVLVSKEIASDVSDGYVQVFSTVSCDSLENLSPDFSECLASPTNLPIDDSNISATVVVVSIVAILMLFVLLLILCFYRRQSKKLKTIEEQIPAVQLAQLRENISVDVNPCYLFGDGTVKSSDLKELSRSAIKLVRALGEGAFGEVFEGIYKINSFETRPIAVKTLPEICTEQNELDFLLEAMIMKNFDHKNIVKFIGVCFTQHPRFIVLELMAGGELKQFLRDNRPVKDKLSNIHMRDLLHVAKNVAEGVCYLESKKFIHRDIAARNILLTSRSADRVAKIGDFGMARDIYGADYYRKSGRALLPVKWMPPEAFLDGIFTAKTDIWSFGVLLWEIMSLGYMPYPGMSNQEVIHFVSTGNRMNPPNKCPPQIYSLIDQCWSKNPEDRPSACLLLERIGYCLQDPDILSSPLPMAIPQLNRQTTVNRPADLENSVTLTVERLDCPSTDLTDATTKGESNTTNDDERRDEVFTRQDSLRQYQFQFPQETMCQYKPPDKMDAKQRQSAFCNRIYQYSASLGEDSNNPVSQRSYRRSASTPEENVTNPFPGSLYIPMQISCDEDSTNTNPFLPLSNRSSNPFTKPVERTSLDETCGLLEYANESTASSNISSVQGSSRSLDNSNLYSENTDGSEQSDSSVRLRERPRSRPGSRRGSAPRTNVRCSKTLSDVEIGAMCDPLKTSQNFAGNIGTNPRLSRNVDGCATFPRSNSRSSESDENQSPRKRSLRRQRNHEMETGPTIDKKSELKIQNNDPVSPGRILKQDQNTGVFLFGSDGTAAVV